jgi:hypothetical protein
VVAAVVVHAVILQLVAEVVVALVCRVQGLAVQVAHVERMVAVAALEAIRVLAQGNKVSVAVAVNVQVTVVLMVVVVVVVVPILAAATDYLDLVILVRYESFGQETLDHSHLLAQAHLNF